MNGPRAPRTLTCDEVRELAGAFVLGALEPADDAAVRSHLASCAEAHEEMDELGGVLPALAEIVPVMEPPAGLKARIMAAAAADLAARETVTPAVLAPVPAVAPAALPVQPPVPAAQAIRAPVPAVPIAFPGSRDRGATETRWGRASKGAWVLRIAAAVAIVALAGWGVLLQGQLNASRNYEQSVAAVLDVAAQPGSLTAILTADGGKGSGLAAVSVAGKVTMAMSDLAPTTGDAVYEAWVIGSDGVPVPLGSFKVGNSGTAIFEGGGLPTVNGIVLALTLEPGPGAKTPTAPVITKGVASSAG